MNRDIQKGLRKQKLISFFYHDLWSPSKAKTNWVWFFNFQYSSYQKWQSKKIKFLSKFQRFIWGINAKALGSKFEYREFQGIGKGPGMQRCMVFECMQPKLERENLERITAAPAITSNVVTAKPLNSPRLYLPCYTHLLLLLLLWLGIYCFKLNLWIFSSIKHFQLWKINL